MAAVCRIGDADVPHCSGMTRATGSPNVFVNGRAISRQGDINTPHVLPLCQCVLVTLLLLFQDQEL